MAGRRVLVVDDETALRRALERVLRLAGYDVHLAEDGGAALAALSDETFAVVVLDIAMPPPDGIQVLRRMRAGGDATPVLVLTARAAVPDRVDGLEAGADDYVDKSVDADRFMAHVKRTLQEFDESSI